MPNSKQALRGAALEPVSDALALDHFLRPGIPKYVALRDAIVRAVTSGAWPPGTRLPNEADLAAKLPFSLGTIQRGLRMLVDDGVIVRRPGAGSFIAQRDAGELHAPLHCRFLDDDGTSYLPVFPRIVDRYATSGDGEWTPHLEPGPKMCIERILRVSNEFDVFSRFWFDSARLPALASRPLKTLARENFKELILRESGLPIGRTTQYLSTARLPADIARHLELRAGVSVQRLDIAAFGGRDRPVYFQTLWIPPNRRRLQLPGDERRIAIVRTNAGQ